MKIRNKIITGIAVATVATVAATSAVTFADTVSVKDQIAEQFSQEIATAQVDNTNVGNWNEVQNCDWDFAQDYTQDYVQDYVNEYVNDYVESVQQAYQEPEYYEETSGNAEYSASDLQYNGVINWGGYTWTYYSQNVLPGGGLDIPGRHVDDNGFVCDENNLICLASSDLSRGTRVSTPFGKDGCVYDSGCASGVLDVYTAW